MIETALLVAISVQECELSLALVVPAAPSPSRNKTRPLSKPPRQIAIHEYETVVLSRAPRE
jgi:hypothetical protein